MAFSFAGSLHFSAPAIALRLLGQGCAIRKRGTPSLLDEAFPGECHLVHHEAFISILSVGTPSHCRVLGSWHST